VVRKLAAAIGVAVGLVVLPVAAGAQDAPVSDTSDADVPYARIDTGDDDPNRQLDFEAAGAHFAALDAAIVAEASADNAQFVFSSVSDLGGFQDAPIGALLWASTGVSLTGVAAPLVETGALLRAAASTTSSTALARIDAAIPELENDAITADGRTTFVFTDDAGDPAPPPDDLPPQTNPPAPPTEGIDAAPTPTTSTTTEPQAPSGTTAPTTTTSAAPAPTTTAAPDTTTTTTTAPSTTTTSTTTTSTTAAPTTTTTTTRPTTTTSTTTPTTTTSTTSTTTPTTTTTTTSTSTSTSTTVPTTTTTTLPPQQSFSLTQERTSVRACVAPSGASQACDAIWSVPLAATGETHTFDLSLRNSGDIDASALQVWAGAACVTTSTATPSGSGDLCDAVQLTVQRYTTSERTIPLECIYGGGTAQLCSLSSARTLTHFSSTYPSGTSPRSIGTGLQDGEAAHLRLTLRLPDVDNRYQRRAATMSLTWRQVQ
jgi:hypothetical protein